MKMKVTLRWSLVSPASMSTKMKVTEVVSRGGSRGTPFWIFGKTYSSFTNLSMLLERVLCMKLMMRKFPIFLRAFLLSFQRVIDLNKLEATIKTVQAVPCLKPSADE